ncbi:hypothetical protein QVD99_000088 [Batrachochytrium dendrobatidis]|nr:hypothetical protein O5D80_008629 [Batrachochytrium dendrobatidis]KAK5664439.1 hypothetical protein QVD99_000088 [Batrachochytrium dendrobatidis]
MYPIWAHGSILDDVSGGPPQRGYRTHPLSFTPKVNGSMTSVGLRGPQAKPQPPNATNYKAEPPKTKMTFGIGCPPDRACVGGRYTTHHPPTDPTGGDYPRVDP